MEKNLSEISRLIIKMCGAYVLYELPSSNWKFDTILFLVNSFILQERRRNNLDKDENFADELFYNSEIEMVAEYFDEYAALETYDKMTALQEIKEYFKDNDIESEVCFVEPV